MEVIRRVMVNINVEENTYRVQLAKLPIEGGGEIERWFVLKNRLPMHRVNSWLDTKGLQSLKTSRRYAYSIIGWMKYLDLINRSYEKAKRKDIKNYIRYLIYGINEELNVLSMDAQITYNTIKVNINAITEFYKWLEDINDMNMELTKKNSTKRASKSFYYGQIWSYDYSETIEKLIPKLKQSKNYIKWYSEQEKGAILSNFNNLRDKVIFELTLEGMRIDEVLSIKLHDYDRENQIIRPSRSKGRESCMQQENKLRPIALSKVTCDELDRYMLTERMDAETESGEISDWLFINLNSGKNIGKALMYRNYYEILKRASIKAGLNPEFIRSHSGRSTKVMELLNHQAQHPEDNITDVMIMHIMGWSSIDSIKHYKNLNDIKIAISVAKKLERKTK